MTWFDLLVAVRNAIDVVMAEYVHPPLREAGFRRSGPTWRRRPPHGDCVVVNVQKSRRPTDEGTVFYVNTGIVPALWWEYQNQHATRSGGPLEADALIRRRVDPPPDLRASPGDGWLIRSVDTIDVIGPVLRRELERVVVDDLLRLLDQAHLLDFIETAPGGQMSRAEVARAVVLAGNGPSSRLDEVVAALDSAQQEPRTRQLAVWLRERANQSTGDHCSGPRPK